MGENADAEKVSLKINWEPFYLNRNIPPEGEDLMEHLTRKYGPAAVARFSAPGNPLDIAGSKVGITFGKKRRVINTNTAHRLMEWVKSTPSLETKQNDLMEALFYAYFSGGNDLTQTDELLKCVESVGLDTEEAKEVIEDDDKYADVVHAKDVKNNRLGISGVPFFVVGGHSLSGAQPPEVFEEILTDIVEE